MKKMLKRFCVLAFIALIGFSFAACDAVGLGGGGSGGGEGNADITGDWEGEIGGYPFSVTLSANSWTLSLSGYGMYETGTYTRSGSTITLIASNDGFQFEFATGVILDSDTIRVKVIYIYSEMGNPGTFMMYRDGTNQGGGNNNNPGGIDIIDDWEEDIGGYTARLTFESADEWRMFQDLGYIRSAEGHYTRNGSTITLSMYIGNGEYIDAGTASILNNDTLRVTFKSNTTTILDYWEGTHTFHRVR